MQSYNNHDSQLNTLSSLDPRQYHLAKCLERSSRVKEIVTFYSHKNQCLLWMESRLELYAAFVREYDDDIIAYTTQPQRFVYTKNDKKRVYTPDALIAYRDGSFAYEEVKPQDILLNADIYSHFSYLKRTFADIIGYPLLLNSVHEDPYGLYVVNLIYLYPYLRYPLDETLATRVTQEADAFLSLETLIKICADFGIDAYFAYQLVAHNYFCLESTDLISPSSLLRRVS